MTAREPLRMRTKLAFGVGSVAEAGAYIAFNSFNFLYYNHVLGLSGTLCGLAVTIALVVDAVCDPVIGFVSDRPRSRLGRRHPGTGANGGGDGEPVFEEHPELDDAEDEKEQHGGQNRGFDRDSTALVARTGVRKNDRILSIGGRPVRREYDFALALDSARQDVRARVERDGKPLEVGWGSFTPAEILDLHDTVAVALDKAGTRVIVEPGTSADRAGLYDGDRIVSIDGEYFDQFRLSGPDGIIQRLGANAGRTVILGIVGQVGDLVESRLKRSVGAKDSGAPVLPAKDFAEVMRWNTSCCGIEPSIIVIHAPTNGIQAESLASGKKASLPAS